jgi:ribonuclease HI
MDNTVIIYTDGACHLNPGTGGWGAVLRYKDVEKHISGGEINTTNNRMELMAAIKSLEALTRPCSVKLYSDSNYVIQGMNEWIRNWKKKNWKNVKNPDLWQLLDQLSTKHKVEWIWVKGHAGIPGNELADKLAGDAVKLTKKSHKVKK